MIASSFFFFKPAVDSRQFFLRELLEVVDHVLQFMTQRLGPRHLVIRGLAVVSRYRAVELSQQFADAFFAGNHSAFFGGHDLRAQRVTLCGQTLQLLAQRIFLRSFAARAFAPSRTPSIASTPYVMCSSSL